MEKTLRELIAEMDRIESSAKLDEGIIDTLRNSVKNAMDQIAYNLGYEPRQPDLAELHTEIDRLNSEMERILEEMDRVSEQIRRHPEHQAQSSNRAPNDDPDALDPTSPDSDPETSRGAPTNSNSNDYRMRNAPQTGPGVTQNR